MLDFLLNLFNTDGFPQRWYCGEWSAAHGWLHILSDIGIWGAYTAIPCVLVYFILTRRDVPFPNIFWFFCAFIFSCGTIHLIEAMIFWWPAYRFLGVIKLITAVISILTVILLVRITPQALRLPGLALVNAQLESEVEQRKRTQENLVKTMADLDEFTYIASHDLQEPLHKMIAFCDLLKKDIGQELPAKAERDMKFISEAAQRMQTLVRDLLLLSKAGRAEVRRKEIPLEQCVNQALEALSVKIQESQASVQYDPLPVVFGDATLLTQLFQNLIGNAIKYRRERPLQIRITSTVENGKQVFGVQDNGIGIQPQYFEQIFAPFKRLHAQSEYEGSGIGLAICRKTVERHGGSIWVESTLGEGSHFKFTLDRGCETA